MTRDRFSRALPSAGRLVLTNLATIAFAVVQGWQLADVIWIYWAQSSIIGFFTVRRILGLKQFSSEGFVSNGKPVPESLQGRRDTAFGFSIIFGGFQLGFLAFLWIGMRPGSWMTVAGLLLGAVLFYFNHLSSYRRHHEADRSRRPNIGGIVLFPVIRILPMHLTLILAGLLGGFTTTLTTVLFLLLKTIADVAMHLYEHVDEVASRT